MEATMRYRSRLLAIPAFAAGFGLVFLGPFAQEKSAKPDFEITSTYIEACSCDMFCPCYFNTRSTNHTDEHNMPAHFCRANLVFKVDKGHYKDVKLDGAKVWLATDLGSDWSTGKDSWSVETYDSSVTPEQKAALADIIAQLYPFKWTSVKRETAPFSWNIDTKTGIAEAKRDDGKAGVTLERVKSDAPGEEVVVKNLHYWNAPSNDGFRMWKSKREYFQGFGQKFDYSGTNGFLITIHFSGDAKPVPPAK
jgi:hypothetical protein